MTGPLSGSGSGSGRGIARGCEELALAEDGIDGDDDDDEDDDDVASEEEEEVQEDDDEEEEDDDDDDDDEREEVFKARLEDNSEVKRGTTEEIPSPRSPHTPPMVWGGGVLGSGGGPSILRMGLRRIGEPAERRAPFPILLRGNSPPLGPRASRKAPPPRAGGESRVEPLRDISPPPINLAIGSFASFMRSLRTVVRFFGFDFWGRRRKGAVYFLLFDIIFVSRGIRTFVRVMG